LGCEELTKRSAGAEIAQRQRLAVAAVGVDEEDALDGRDGVNALAEEPD
jgi:hypothetical protein